MPDEKPKHCKYGARNIICFHAYFLEEILQHFHWISQALQNEHVKFKSCADLYSSLTDYLHASRKEFKGFEEVAREIMPGMDYKATHALKHRGKNVVHDGGAPEVSLNSRDKFCISAVYVIIDNLSAEMSRRGQVYDVIAYQYSCLVNVHEALSTKETVHYSECCEEVINAYREDLN